MQRTTPQPHAPYAAFAAAAFAASLSLGCRSLDAGDGAVKSVRLIEQIGRITVETDRSEEAVQVMLARLQVTLTSRDERSATQAYDQLDAANRSCLRHAQRLERQLVSLDHEGTVFFTRRREALEEVSDPEVRLGAAANLELDLEHFLEYQASAVAALDAYDELNLELDAILEVLSARPEPRDLTDEALDLRNHAWSLRMILEDCERASSAFDMR